MIITTAQILPLTTNRFIVLDGVNGAGKSTVLRHLVAALTARGFTVTATFEPGDTALGREIRPLLLDPKRERPTPMSELFLFAADRAEHVAKTIRPALQRGDYVVSDRYYYSTEAFQGYGRGLDRAAIQSINLNAIDGMVPALVILLDLDPQVGLERTRTRRSITHSPDDAFETETLAFHQRMRQGFLEIAERVGEPVLILDASQSEATVLKMVDSVAAKL